MFSDLPANTNNISHVIKIKPQKAKDPMEEEIDRFCRLFESAKNWTYEDIGTDDEDEHSLRKSNIKKVLKEVSTSALELEKTLPNPSEKNKAKLRKVHFENRITISNLI